MCAPRPSRRRFTRRAGLAFCIGSTLAGGSAWAQSGSAASTVEANAATAATTATAPITLAPTTVVGTTPLLGIGTPLSQVPSNVQTVHASDIEHQHGNTLTDYFGKNLPSVDLSDAQGNPYQVNINYRGFIASPVLGTPQGLSVFLDGVRVNEPFGNVVNWDWIAQDAIDAIQLIPGSNPTYGLNTLGGAIAITTRNGKTSPGGEAEVTGGSWGRKTAQARQGGVIGQNLDYFVSANAANDGGWADHNASRVRQVFGKLRYIGSETTLSLSAGGADNALQGTQTIPRSFLDNPKQAYTFPDENRNRVGYLTLSGDHYFNDDVELSGNAYFRHFSNTNTSSNVNGDFGSVNSSGAIDTLQGTNVRSVVDTDSYGASTQLTLLGKLGAMQNQLVVGAAADFANSHYTRSSQDAAFTASRAAIGTSDFAQQTNAKTRDTNLGVYFDDTLSLTKQWTLTLAGRYNWAHARIGDESGTQPLLNGDHTFSRFNPAIGINWNPSPRLTAYATYNEGMRSPTAIELACADPAAPCALPNDFVADPPLKPVISKTFEVGARGRMGADTTWSAAVFNTTLFNDIEFVSSAGSTQGFFQNVGNVRRQGLELTGRTRFGPLGVTLSYSHMDATYRSAWTRSSPANSSADANGNITVMPGDHVAGIPENTAKLRLDYAASAKWNIGTNLVWRGGIYAQGDENNADANGKIAGYLLVDLDTTYQVTKQLQLFATVTNLFNRRYASFGALGTNLFNGPGHTFDPSHPVSEQFVGPGAPRGAWVGLRYTWN